MDFIIDLIREHGVGIVFLNVLIEQLGAPIPAYPVLMVTAAIQGGALHQQLLLVLVAVGAAMDWGSTGLRHHRMRPAQRTKPASSMPGGARRVRSWAGPGNGRMARA